MSSPFLRWLLGVETIPADATDVHLGWEHPLPPWGWFLVIAGATALGFWAYRRMRGPRPARITLGVIRAALLLLLTALICGPMLVQPREFVERGWVLLLVDRSASLEVADATIPDRRGRVSRDEQLVTALRAASGPLEELSRDRVVVWLGFDGGVFDLSFPSAASSNLPGTSGAPGTGRSDGSGGSRGSGTAGGSTDSSGSTGTDESRRAGTGSTSESFTTPLIPSLGSPTGWRTRIGTALDQALLRAAARPLAGVVLFSDGRTTEPPSRTVVRRLQDAAVPVFTVALGSEEPVGDLAIRRTGAPAQAFVRDTVPVTVDVERLGGTAQNMTATARLIDTRTGTELDRATLVGGGGRELESVTLVGRSDAAGEANWAVVLDVDGDDLVAENNRRELTIGLIDRPVRVLYVDGYPRWEYRYLKNLLIREPSIDSSILLLSADRDFAQEGNMPLSRLPRTAEEFAPYDLVIIGDIPASFFTSSQLEILRTAVAERGMGVLWIGGEQAMPLTWGDTELTDLLPMRGPLELAPIGAPVQMTSTPLADRLGVLQLSDGSGGGQAGGSSGQGRATTGGLGSESSVGSASSPDSPGTSSSSSAPSSSGSPGSRAFTGLSHSPGWPRELIDPDAGWSALQWAQRIDPGQLKPTAEVLAETTEPISGEPLPLVMSMRYGAGMSLYVATDEIWRWRFGRGELLPEQFWIQLVRMLARERIAGGAETILLDAEPRRVAPGQPLRVTLRMLDESLAGIEFGSIAAVVETPDGDRIADLDLRPTGRGGEYSAIYVPTEGDALGSRSGGGGGAGPRGGSAAGGGSLGGGSPASDPPGGGPSGGDPSEPRGSGAPGSSSEAGTDRPTSGRHQIRIADTTLPEATGLTAEIELLPPDEERRRPEADHALLRTLATETGGRFLLPTPDDLAQLAQLPRRELRSEDPITERIWNTPLALILVILLAATEWAARRRLGVL